MAKDPDLEKLTIRLNKCKGEYVYSKRKREEDIQVAVRAFQSISDEDVEILSAVIPQLRVMKQYTEKELSENLHGEIGTVREVAQALKRYVEDRLNFLEAQL